MTLGVLLLALALPVSIAGVNVALGVLSVFALAADGGAKRWRALAHPVFYALTAYCAVGLLCGALGVDPARSLKLWPKDFHKLWAATLLLLAFSTGEAPPVLAAGFGAGFALSSLVAIGQVLFLTTEWSSRWVRAHGFVHPVTFGCMTTLGLLGAVCFLIRTPAPLAPYRRLIKALTALLVVALILNQSRTSVVSAVAGALAIGLVDRRARRWSAAVIVSCALAVVIWERMPTGGRTISALMGNAAPAEVSGQRARLVLWDVAWRMFKDHPVTGAGPGGYGQLFTRYFDGVIDGQRGWGAAHNIYLHQLAERGVLGLIALLAVFAALLRSAWRAERELKSAWSLWAWCGLSAFAVMNLTENAFQTEQLATLALLIWAAGEAGVRRRP